VAGIDDLDADRDPVEVSFALPVRYPGVEGAPRLGDEPPQRPLLLNEIMRADADHRVA
jgi:hypothetical protein